MSVSRPPSAGEELMAMHLTAYKIPFVREYIFHDKRKWRADFAVGQHILIEIEGGTRNQGRHSRHDGFVADCVKYAEANLQGWHVYRFATEQVQSGYAIDTILKAIEMDEQNGN